MMDFFDTICAPATVPGTGAITVIRVSGSQSLKICDAVLRCAHGSCSDAPGYTIKRADALDSDGSVLDDVLVSIFRAPHSYTGEDSAEISCHASAYIATRLMERLCSAGARSALPGEFTRRAFVNGKMDLAQAEAVADVISSNSTASHRVALNQLRGGYSAQLGDIRAQLLEITALLELELDFSEEDVEFADRSRLRSLVSEAISRVSSLAESFHLGNAIKNGIPVVIAGEPNTGKSTLLNALLGEQRAIISPIAGTTRDTIEETMTVDGILFRFIDTAGLRETEETVELLGIERTRQMISKADIVLGLVDGSLPEASLEMAKSAICSEIDFSKQKLLLLVNKIDLNKNVKGINNFVSTAGNKVDVIYISAKTSEGLDTLRSKLSETVKMQLTGLRNSYSSGGVEEGSCSAGAADPGLVGAAAGVVDSGVEGDDAGVAASGAARIDDTGVARDAEVAAASSDVTYSVRDKISMTGTAAAFAQDQVLVTNIRHYEALRRSLVALTRVRDGLATSLPSDLVAQDLRESLAHLGEITGEISTDEVLGEIFKKFCIGK